MKANFIRLAVLGGIVFFVVSCDKKKDTIFVGKWIPEMRVDVGVNFDEYILEFSDQHVLYKFTDGEIYRGEYTSDDRTAMITFKNKYGSFEYFAEMSKNSNDRFTLNEPITFGPAPSVEIPFVRVK